MRLLNFKVTNYRCIEDSGLIEVDPSVTCLVGKNESGKTTLLYALHRLNSIEQTSFEVTKDYPSKGYIAYKRQVEKGQPAESVLTAIFSIEAEDLAEVRKVAGEYITAGSHLTVTLDYDKKCACGFTTDELAAVQHFVGSAGLTDATTKTIQTCTTLQSLATELQKATDDPKAKELLSKLQTIANFNLHNHVWENILKLRLPKIMYFDDYRIMAGNASLDILQNEAALKSPDNIKLRTLRDLLDLAGVKPADLKQGGNYEHHIRLLRAMANSISDEVFEYWTQNREENVPKDAPQHALSALEVQFDVDGHSQILHVRINNKRHRVDVDFDERSRGFVWFFSFLAAFKKIVEQHNKLIILLDEPGLNLHGKAQADLLRFIEERLAEKGHQVIYTTHSPFMIDPHKLERTRTVEDKIDLGTKVSRNWASVDSATAFPLQAALGYDMAQTLFVGPNCLCVEGPSDLLYLQSMSTLLEVEGRQGLDLERWTITPVGGADKLSTFVALLGSNSKLNVVVLMDHQKGDQQRVQDILDTGKLEKSKLVLFSKFAGSNEADIEDMFDEATYLEFVKKAYPAASDIDPTKLGKQPRLAARVAAFLEAKGLKAPFHFKPAQAAVELLAAKVRPTKETLDRFEKLFKYVNKLLPK